MKQIFSLIKPVELKCEYRINPTGIDEKHPRFSWFTPYDEYNSFQTAYRIIIATSINHLLLEIGTIWDSGKITSSDSTLIKFNGKSLHSNTTYYWMVMVWNDNDEPSSWSNHSQFSTGLFNENEWQAKWISHVYDKKYEPSFGFRQGEDKWIWYPLKNLDEKFQTIYFSKLFRIEDIKFVKSAILIVTADEKLRLSINKKFITKSDNKIFSWARPIIIDVKNQLKNGINVLEAIGFNSYVEKPGLILRLEIKFTTDKLLLIHTDRSWKASIDKEKIYTINAEEVAVSGDKPWRIPHSGLYFYPAGYFKKTFQTNKKVKRAFVYCSALGLYDLRINGKQVGDGSRLRPGWSDFNNRVYYNCYDVTSIICSYNEHVINIILADGYYSGYCGWEKRRGYYGKNPAVKLQLMISYDDNTNDIICTDEDWLSSEGPIREADILMGEHYDTNYESLIDNWETFQKNDKFKKVKVISKLYTHLNLNKADEVKVRQELMPISIKKIEEQKFIVDFGQNFAGFVRLILRNVGKQKVILRFAEVLNEDGSLYTENLRMARAQDTYISRGDSEEIWEPLFTYHGFRYVEVSGLEKIDDQTFIGISVNSLPEQTSYFISSNPKLNRLYECILWNQRSNYLDIPTDCPQRDERFGWTGDALSFFRTAAFNFDVSSFYNNWFENLFDAQRIDGALPPFAPLADMGVGPIYFNSAGWADAGIITPFLFYEFYKDINLLEKYYDRMKLYFDSILAQSKDFILGGNGYGDWLFIGEETSKSFIATSYFAYDCSLMKKISLILGHTDDSLHYDNLFQKIKQSFKKKFLNADGSLIQMTQTSAILSLHFDLLDEDEIRKVKSFLIKDIINKNYHITTGFLGLSFLMPVLSSLNRNDIAWKVLTNNDFPSWFFMIDNGATTLWERWDSFHPHKGFYDPTMNSFNHCSLGCIGEWLITGIAGINPLNAGFNKILIKPFIPEDLDYAQASFKTSQGFIKSGWKKNDDSLLMNISIPFNTKAIIDIPSDDFELNGVFKIIKKENGHTYIEVGSGNYEIIDKY